MIKYYSLLFAKGALMGAANVIPGVSGGTIALLCGIFIKLINSIKSFDITAVRLIMGWRLKEFSAHVNLAFLAAVFAGTATSIITLAKLMKFLFESHEVHLWSFFFGLVLASVYFVGRRVKKFNLPVIMAFCIGTGTAIGISFLEPAAENSSIPYLLACGIVAMCSMILPGLSGSYVLLLMGNYRLVMVEAVADFKLGILFPVAIGAAIGLLAFSHFLAWLFKRFHDLTIAVLTGFIFGSLRLIWPWKTALTREMSAGSAVKTKVIGYDYLMPEFSAETILALMLALAGMLIIVLIETRSAGIPHDNADESGHEPE